MFCAFGISEKGRVRPTNEDCFEIDLPLRLCIVADGMGGHNAGEVASRIAVSAVVEFMNEPESWPFGFDPVLSHAANRLRTAVQVANLQVLETATTHSEYRGMGTTIVAAIVSDGHLTAAHVGDSRLYLYSKRRLRQLTHDDSWMASMFAASPAAGLLRDHPMRHALTNVIGARPGTQVHIVEEAVSSGDLFALTTDGVHGVLDDRRIERELTERDDAQTMAQGLVQGALGRGSRDNCTAVVGRYMAD